jgi:TctA family transporter
VTFFNNDLGLFFTRPIASVLLCLCIVTIAFPVIMWTKERKRNKELPAG